MSLTRTFHDADPGELADWDARCVDEPGGHVYQSRAWAAHRGRSGWTPRFLVGADGGRVLALTRAWPMVRGGSAYIPRGPVPLGADPAHLASRLVAVGDFLAADGIDVLAADAEVPAAAAEYRSTIEAAGFHAIEEIQPSRHRVSLPLGPGADESTVLQATAKSTRQRIRAAEAAGVTVVRHDARAGTDGAGEGFVAPTEPSDGALDAFYDLLLETGERRQFSFGPRAGFVSWWRAALAAGHLVYLEARLDRAANEDLAGLILYRHGGRLSTVHSGDHAAMRASHPGALHLLRWRAIQLAIREGSTEMDLGGVDTAGARGQPQKGDALYGLYQHKTSFGGRWLALTGAHERAYDQRGYQLGRVASRLAGLAGRR
ncbi:MAG: GNAT family N-acetyltransferase [Thermomicrobiales bacterium]|nr:MAG: GNAT family N-acetyltransferase [Thermomicrobiales bacterium]